MLGPGNNAADELFVLSLPAFRWFKADYRSLSPRTKHQCQAVHSQMVLIGGLNPASSNQSMDPWVQGIGVFDMTSLEWKASFEAKAALYKSPDVVRQYYNKYAPT